MSEPEVSERKAVFAGLFAGLCFGLFWIPIRMVEAAGFDAPWAIVVFTGLPALMCLPIAWRFRLDYVRGGRGLIGGVLAGVAYALYTASLLYTDVVRAILLFYLMPVWGFLLGWLILKDAITPARWLSIVLGLAGMFVIFADETGLPLPRNVGDWFGLAAGVFWAVGCLLVLIDKKVSAQAHAVNFFLVGAALAIALALVADWQGWAARPDWSNLGEILWWFVPISFLFILPAGLATIYAPTRLNPGVVGLLFMTEIAVAALTAAIWAGEPLGLREAIGLPLILCAGLAEPVMSAIRARRARAAQ